MNEMLLAITLILIAIALFKAEWNEPPPQSSNGWFVAGFAVRLSLIATLIVLTMIVAIALLTLL
jgi:hypothetical protein